MREALPVFRRALGDSWRSLIAWTLGVAAALLLYLPLFPSIGGNGEMQQIIDSMPRELVKTLGYEQISSGPGYVQGTFFGLIGFLLLVIAATSWGSGAIAGAEESGRLELTLAHGVGRAQYALESALAVLARLLWLGLVAFVIVLALDDPSQLDIDPGALLAAVAALLGLTFLSGAVALLVGASTGRRILATAAGAGVAVVGYVLNAIANQVADAEWVRAASPYSWAYQEQPLTNGADGPGLVLLWGSSALLVAASAVVLRVRDITG
ncbi:ABC-2 type transport system permease protein [Diaminobutyricimonas aerilata]|uniref:ABC-2 type transport system permease protein n=1 Tax=Diaminobutyricimonas aerilata TaxID=1162967 RepID=A0A2M9CNX0_9MICO|nr:ABC transporter permease subunit [Diaminobutyricimonas aerilata]PJJ73572.1 ABC-2 type transport system permease protein [Diaminobutyricimonas aerilata]